MIKKYSTKEVSEKLDISPDLIRKYCKFFEIEVERKQLENGKTGHRQFSDENIEDLEKIVEAIGSGITWENVKAARNGDKVIIPKKPSSEVDDKIEALEKTVKMLVEKVSMIEGLQAENEALRIENTELKNQPLQIEHRKEESQKEETKKKSLWQRLFG